MNTDIINGYLFPLMNKGRADNVLYRAQNFFSLDLLRPDAISEKLKKFPITDPLIFPSHFFEYEHLEQLLLAIRSRPFSVQISTGAELIDYEERLIQLEGKKNFLGAEVIMNRAPHEGDYALLKSRRIFRYVYCPVIEINALKEIEKISPQILQNLYFTFPIKKHPRDSFLNEDAAFVLCEKLKARGINVKKIHYDISWENKNAPQLLETNKPKHKNQVNALRFQAKNIATTPLLWIPYGLVWLMNSPISALLTVYWKIHDFVDSSYLFTCRILSLVRHSFIMSLVYSYVGLVRVFFFFYHKTYVAIVATYYFFSHPIWSIREFAPPVYYLCFFPFFKIYWFLEYQYKKIRWKNNYESR